MGSHARQSMGKMGSATQAAASKGMWQPGYDSIIASVQQIPLSGRVAQD